MHYDKPLTAGLGRLALESRLAVAVKTNGVLTRVRYARQGFPGDLREADLGWAGISSKLLRTLPEG